MSPLAQFLRLTDATHSKLFLKTHLIWKLSSHKVFFITLLFSLTHSEDWHFFFSSCKGLRRAFQLSSQIVTHPQSLFAYTWKWQNHAAPLPRSCRGWLTALAISCQIDYNTDEAWNILNTAETFQFSKDSDSEINAPRSDVWKAWSGEELLKFRG